MQDMDRMRQFLSAPGLGRGQAGDSALVGLRPADIRPSSEYKSSQKSILLGGKPVPVVGDGRAQERSVCGTTDRPSTLNGTFN